MWSELNYNIHIKKVNTFFPVEKYDMLIKERWDMVRYTDMVCGIFRQRPNRFIAHVEIGGRLEICHVKNTGRCKELLVPGTTVWCQRARSPERKTKFDLIAVQKGERLINMDSQAPNVAAKEWLLAGGLGKLENLRVETFHGDSRFDFSFDLDGRKCFLEVKGVTLENDGVCAFPDAPTQRGTKHLRGLIHAVKEGYGAYVLFVIQMSDVKYMQPNDGTDPVFAQTLREAAAAGVQILAVECQITPDTMVMDRMVDVR